MIDDKDLVDESSEESFPASDPPSFTARAKQGAADQDGAAGKAPCGDAEVLKAMLAEDLEVEQMCAVLFMQHAEKAAKLGNSAAHDALQKVAGQSREIAKELGKLVMSAG